MERSAVWNRIVLESKHFVVVPSLGSLVEGWLMIVPRAHSLSIAALPPALFSELDQVKAEVHRLLVAEYGSSSFFEHGPAGLRRSTGCGVDHAHLHAVPIAGNLIVGAQSFLPAGVTFRPGGIEECTAAIKVGADYLYVEQPVGYSYVAVHSAFASQTLRKVIAAQLGVVERFNWREYPQIENIEATLGRLVPQVAALEAIAV